MMVGLITIPKLFAGNYIIVLLFHGVKDTVAIIIIVFI